MLRKNSYDILLLVGLAIVASLYFVTANIEMDRHTVGIEVDRHIPFSEIFVIPYLLWYGYVYLSLIYIFFRSKADFRAIAIYLILGIGISCVIFLVYPTRIDFRPDFFMDSNWMISLVEEIYRVDQPANVLPSLHCFEAAATCIGVWHMDIFKHGKLVKTVYFILAVLICLSTVMIKQHSIVDLVTGILLAFVLMPVCTRVRRDQNNKINLQKN